jgi:hypothetical protein
MRYCPERKSNVDEKVCENCLFYQPQKILNPCCYKDDKCKDCKKEIK